MTYDKIMPHCVSGCNPIRSMIEDVTGPMIGAEHYIGEGSESKSSQFVTEEDARVPSHVRYAAEGISTPDQSWSAHSNQEVEDAQKDQPVGVQTFSLESWRSNLGGIMRQVRRKRRTRKTNKSQAVTRTCWRWRLCSGDALTGHSSRLCMGLSDVVDCSPELFQGLANKTPALSDVSTTSPLLPSKVQFRAAPATEVRENIVDKQCVKLIFLDMDGPMVPWGGRKSHEWKKSDSFDAEPYARNVEALKRIVCACGGPEVIKIVLSSNWRTSDEKTLWLKDQFDRCGIDMIGHTDQVHVHASAVHENGSVLLGKKYELVRDMEIYRVLHHNIMGQGGPRFNQTKKCEEFMPRSLPTHWEITAWIAIDDLALASVPLMAWDEISHFCCFIHAPGEMVGETGWLIPPREHAGAMRIFSQSLREHFVRVHSHRGIAGTVGAVEMAIQLLTGASAEAVSQKRDISQHACTLNST